MSLSKGESLQLHASCVALKGRGVLLLGGSGAGKSDVALRLIDGGAALVADDQVEVRREGNVLIARPPATIAGLLEVRGVGIRALPHGPAPLALAIELVAREEVVRMPEPCQFDCLGLSLPLYRLHAFDASTTAKIRLLI